MGISGCFKKGKDHPLWKGGKGCLSPRGYVKIRTKEGRDKWAHRWAIEKLLKDPIGLIFTPGQGIPKGHHIHHVDSNKGHNCVGNLMMLDRAIHAAITKDRIAWIAAHYEEWRVWIDRDRTPDWVTNECPDVGADVTID